MISERNIVENTGPSHFALFFMWKITQEMTWLQLNNCLFSFSDFDAEIVQWNKGGATQRGSRNTEGDQRASIQIKVKVADI